MDKIIEDELKIWAEERKLSRQMAAAAERDWIKREDKKGLAASASAVIGEEGKKRIGERISKRELELFKEKNVKKSV